MTRNEDFILVIVQKSICADCFGLVATVSPAFDRRTVQVPAPQCDDVREWNSAN